MKKIQKLAALALASVSVCGLTVGCNGGGGGQTAGDDKTVQIYAWESGYGIDWLQQIVDDFNKGQSEYKATLEYSAEASAVINTLDLGKSNNYDLYFTMLQSSKYNDDFIEMTELLNSSPTGETGKIRDKYRNGLLDSLKDKNGKEKFLCYGYGNAGIVYNCDIISEDKVPNTTTELETLVTELAGNKSTPWLFYNESGINGYWNYLTEAWAAQYNGLDYHYNTFYQLKAADGTTPSKDVLLAKDGRYKALEVMEAIITPDTTHSQCTNTNYTTVQTLYLEGGAAMMPNGSWLLNETGGTHDNFNMMKVPVISSIVEKLEDTSMTDETLSAIVAEVDEGKTSSTLCSANDFARIKEARNLMYNNSTESYIFAPKYSNALDGVKAFLQWYHKDSSVLKYNQSTKLPAACKLNDETLFDVSSQSLWTKTMFHFAEELTPLTQRLDRSEVFSEQGNNSILNITTANYLLASNKNDRKNANQLWINLESRVNEFWSDWVK